MSPATHDALRARVCDIIRQLGAALDGLAMAAEVSRLPSDAAVDALIAAAHLDEAACAVESTAALVEALARDLDKEITATKQAAAVMFGEEAARE